jgi:hypothetical protein
MGNNSKTVVLRPQFRIFLLSKCLLCLAKLLYFSVISIALCDFRRWNRSEKQISLLAIESGKVGWTLIEYEELLASAFEYFGPSGVLKVCIEERKHYLRETYRVLRKSRITHYVYDPRTGAQTFGKGLFQSFVLIVLFAWFKVVPIARLSDMPVRKWRLQCAVVTAALGICTTLMEPSFLKYYFPHKRLVGPMMMALSHGRVLRLHELRKSIVVPKKTNAIFTGAMYEPRATILSEIREGLRSRGLDLELQVRNIGEERDSNDSYWQRLIDAEIVVTTADQSTGLGAEPIDLPHLVYRYTEVLASGSLLVAPIVPGVDEYFRPGVDFVSFQSVADAVDQISYYLGSESERRSIAESGSMRLLELVESHSFWKKIDLVLQDDGFIRLI